MNPVNEELFQAMLYKIASDPEVIESISGNAKDELWLERQEVKRWYEERIEGLPGDEYISRCTQMVDWWLKKSGSKQDVVRMFRDFVSQDNEDGIGSRSIADAKSDFEDLNSLLTQQYEATGGSERWFVLAEAVAECAVGCLIEINEDISENVEEDHLRVYFEGVRDFWDSFYDIAFQGKELPESEVESDGQRTSSQAQEKAQASNGSSATTSDFSSDSKMVAACTREALETIESALDDRSHQLNQVGGFSKIPDDFRFLGVLKLGLEFGHLKREGLLLYACLNSYCVTLLRKLFILQRNQYLEEKGAQPSARVQGLIEEASNDMVSSLQNIVETRAQACFQSLRNFRASSPTAARISFESQLPDALDMALAALREAMGQATALESSEGIERSEGLAAILLAYGPTGLDDFESQFRQSPWAFYNASDLCISVLEGIVSSPKQFLERIFKQWQEFQRDDSQMSKINRQQDKVAECRTSEVLLDKREISNPVTTRHEKHGHASQPTPVEDATSSTSQTVLVGAALIKNVQAMGDSTPGDQARACGYILCRQPQTGDVEAFYAALYEAYRAVRK
jgi:hypothetical protein